MKFLLDSFGIEHQFLKEIDVTIVTGKLDSIVRNQCENIATVEEDLEYQLHK